MKASVTWVPFSASVRAPTASAISFCPRYETGPTQASVAMPSMIPGMSSAMKSRNRMRSDPSHSASLRWSGRTSKPVTRRMM